MIRKAILGDLDAICKIEQTFDAEAFSRRSLRHFVIQESALVLEEGDIRGYCIVTVRTGSTLARLYSIAIAEQYRGKGYGIALLRAGEQEARTLGRSRMGLEVAEGNLAARSLYAREGYLEVERIEGYYESGEAAFRLRKLLP